VILSPSETSHHEEIHPHHVLHLPQLSQSSIYAQYGFTKLFKTAGRGNVILVKELIKKGADVNIKNLVSLYVDLAFKFEMFLSGPNLTYTSLSPFSYIHIHIFI
jgi:hypothetical protein